MSPDINFHAIAHQLESHHVLFRQFWSLGTPVWSRHISTAGVGFDQDGQCVQFLFNPKFWSRLDDTSRLFVIGHECLHVILNHGARIKSTFDSFDQRLANVAMDVVVNSLLVRQFGFNREELHPEVSEKGCWYEDIFDEAVYAQEAAYFEFYFHRLRERCQDGHGNPELPTPFDDHEQIDRLPSHVVEGAVESAGEQMSPSEAREWNESIGGGGEGGSQVYTVPVEPIDTSRRWETVVKDWVRQRREMMFDEQWGRPNRRLQMMDQDLMLPSEHWTISMQGQDRIQVWFFQDASQSCEQHIERFFRAAESIPDDKFEVRFFAFDTTVTEVDMDDREVEGGGGTSFKILGQYVRREIRENECDYPEAVFVLTDGYGNQVNLAYPERWHWFLTEVHTTRHIPSESHVYTLDDFE